jgi:Raf kinase inhibitor-like YbhB/YbcL family protein
MIGAACRHDGRNLRPPTADQNASISTLPASSTTAGFSDGGTLDSSLTDDTNPDLTVDGTLPASDELTITAPWTDGGSIAAKYTCDGSNLSPALSWTAAPDGTKAIAVTLADLDAPNFVHWVVAGLAPTEVGLDEDTVPVGVVEATNGAGSVGYTGPCPPAGSTHHYLLKVHYLGDVVNLTDGATAKEMLDAINAAELASAEVTGTYRRP